MSQEGTDRNERNKRDREIDDSNAEIIDLVPDRDICSPQAKKDRREVEKMESWKWSNVEKE